MPQDPMPKVDPKIPDQQLLTVEGWQDALKRQGLPELNGNVDIIETENYTIVRGFFNFETQPAVQFIGVKCTGKHLIGYTAELTALEVDLVHNFQGLTLSLSDAREIVVAQPKDEETKGLTKALFDHKFYQSFVINVPGVLTPLVNFFMRNLRISSKNLSVQASLKSGFTFLRDKLQEHMKQNRSS